MLSSVGSYASSGTGITEYSYQLCKHIKKISPVGTIIDKLYALPKSKRNNTSGILYTNTLFKNKLRAVQKEKYDIIYI